MPIEVECEQCGKRLRAPDSAAGRRAKCPQCGQPVQIPDRLPDRLPEPNRASVYEAEAIDGFGAESGTGFGADFARRRASRASRTAAVNEPAPLGGAAEHDDRPRKPCPVCGEEIVATARKCRHCGETLDRSPGEPVRASRTQIRRFRTEANSLGGFWIAFGGGTLALGLVFLIVAVGLEMAGDFAPLVALVLVPLGLGLLICGVCTCLKQPWAMYTGLVLSYIAVPLSLLVHPCAIVMTVAAVVQGHRVISLANTLQKAGVPLRD